MHQYKTKILMPLDFPTEFHRTQAYSQSQGRRPCKVFLRDMQLSNHTVPNAKQERGDHQHTICSAENRHGICCPEVHKSSERRGRAYLCWTVDAARLGRGGTF